MKGSNANHAELLQSIYDAAYANGSLTMPNIRRVAKPITDNKWRIASVLANLVHDGHLTPVTNHYGDRVYRPVGAADVSAG
jgi:hypothetical protein